MKRIIILNALFFLGLSLRAQPYVSAKTRHRFAQLNLGTDLQFYSAAGTSTWKLNAGNQLEKESLDPHTLGRLIIGGTHFWGHADFFIAIPLVQSDRSGFRSSVETAARYFPWRIESGKLRPFLGAGWMSLLYKQGEGVQELRHRFPISSGLLYCHKIHLLSLNASYIPSNNLNYYISEHAFVRTQLPRFSMALTYKIMIETTLSSEKNWLNGKTKKLTDTLEKLRKLDGLTLAVGVSSAFYLKKSSHNKNFPYLKEHRAANIFPEFGLGYYFNNPDLQLNLSYRKMTSHLEAYGREQTARRSTFALELYKFCGDYHGFVPFFGGIMGYENLKLRDKAADASQQDYNDEQIRPGLIFGWDIRPDRLQSFYLRTNLRWTPDLKLKTMTGKSFSFDQLEVNFIELILFPGRIF